MFLPDGLDLRPSPLHGFGLFATHPLPGRKTLGPYEGIRYTLKDFKQRYGSDTEHCYVARRYNYVICAKEPRTWITYVNESKDPNCRIHAHHLKTLRPIAEGEELTLQYPPSYPRTYNL